jgi:hypothetical protein
VEEWLDQLQPDEQMRLLEVLLRHHQRLANCYRPILLAGAISPVDQDAKELRRELIMMRLRDYRGVESHMLQGWAANLAMTSALDVRIAEQDML